MKNFFVVVFLTLFLVSFVSAISVSGTYTSRNPLEAYPGEIKDFVLNLQNMAGEGDDVKFEASIVEGSEVVSLTDGDLEYLVPFGVTDGVDVGVRVAIPDDAVIGTEYDAHITFDPMALGTEEEGMIQIELGLARYFKIVVVEQPPEADTSKELGIGWIILGIIAVIALVAVVWLIIKSRKETSIDTTQKPAQPVKKPVQSVK